MAVQIEPIDDEYSRTSVIRLRVGVDGATTCAEIPRDELIPTIQALFGWLAWTDEAAAMGLLKNGLFLEQPRLTMVEITRLGNARAIKAYELRRSGLTFAQIGEQLGVGTQRAWELAGKGARLVSRRASQKDSGNG